MTRAAAVAGLDMHGLDPRKTVHWNLSPVQLYEKALERGEGRLAHMGAFAAITAPQTGSSIRRSDSSATVDVERLGSGCYPSQCRPSRGASDVRAPALAIACLVVNAADAAAAERVTCVVSFEALGLRPERVGETCRTPNPDCLTTITLSISS